MQLDLQIDKLLTGFRLSVRFACEAGVVVLFRPSGSGKSLTLQCLAGIVQPDHGRIVLDPDTLYDSALRISVSPCGHGKATPKRAIGRTAAAGWRWRARWR